MEGRFQKTAAPSQVHPYSVYCVDFGMQGAKPMRLHAAVSASLEPQAAAFVGSSIIELNAEAKLSNVERHPENAAV